MARLFELACFMAENLFTTPSLEIFNFKCFDETGSGVFKLQDLNFVIGRNNAGKSAVVDFFEISICRLRGCDSQKHDHKGQSPTFVLKRELSEQHLRSAFRLDTSGGNISMNHWEFGSKLIGQSAIYECDPRGNGQLRDITCPDAFSDSTLQVALSMLRSERFQWPFDGAGMVRVAAERNVQPEVMGIEQLVHPNGQGLTNAITRQINDASLSREVAERDILADLNEVYQGDAEFTEIVTRIDGHNLWEIYLREVEKGDIRLSESGSGLKTILLITTLIHIHYGVEWNQCIFAIDEPENNLHPALFRRLLEYLSKMQQKHGFTLIVTTHSPIAIDWATRRANSQVIHVTHDGKKAKLNAANDYISGRSILDDLDIRASDILQANGIIWVEGPSDRIYLRRWLDLYSDGDLKEGIHYTIMFYGGKLLAHLSADSLDAQTGLIALLSMNRNAALLIDSDRRLAGKTKTGKTQKPRMHINGTKKRIKEEMEKLGGFVWVTEGKEVENYIPIKIYAELTGQLEPTVSQYYDMVGHPLLAMFKEDKIKLAHAVAEVLVRNDMDGILDLNSQIEQLSTRITKWNGTSG